jgi:hypothetical protein
MERIRRVIDLSALIWPAFFVCCFFGMWFFLTGSVIAIISMTFGIFLSPRSWAALAFEAFRAAAQIRS